MTHDESTQQGVRPGPSTFQGPVSSDLGDDITIPSMGLVCEKRNIYIHLPYFTVKKQPFIHVGKMNQSHGF